MKWERNLKIGIEKKYLAKSSLFFLNIILILLSINLLTNNFVIIDPNFMRISCLYLLFSLLLLNLPFKKILKNLKKVKTINKPSKNLFFGIGLIIFSFILLITTKNVMLWLSSIPIFISGLDLTLKGIYLKREEFYLITFFSLSYVIFYVLIQTITIFWNLIRDFSYLVSRSIGALIGKSMLFGPSVSGLWIVIISLILTIVCYFLTSNKKLQLKKFLFTIIGISIGWIIYLVILGFFEFKSKFDVVNLHIILFIICLIPILFYLFKLEIKEGKLINLSFNKINIKKIILNKSVWAIIFLFLSSLILTSFFSLEEKKPDEETNILFYAQDMLGSWDIPEYGKYGREGAGMFGLLPIYLSASGFENTLLVNNITAFINTTQPAQENITSYVNLTDYVEIIESNNVNIDILYNIDIFVITNINKSFSPDEKKVIWEFVEKGGSLLVLGDHTNVGGIQDPLNDLLKPVEISFNFDSALPLDSKFKWLTCYQLMYHPITYNLNSYDEIQISVGASLNTPLNAFPIVSGRYGLSDRGNSLNEDFSFLGDYEYNQGEEIGDIILAAATYYGEGKVIVFGDTSTFQNGALPYSYSFIHNIFTWLKSEQPATTIFLQNAVSILLLIAAIIFVFSNKKKSIHKAVFPFVFALGLLISVIINPLIIPDMQISGNVVYIDSSHNERFNLEPFTEKSVNGLILNLNRNGYIPIILREFSEERIEKSKMLIFNAPSQSITPDEVEFLSKYMSNGGIIILATGYSDKLAVSNLLDKYNIGILDVPLGPFPYVEENPEEYENEPRFVDSWPTVFDENIGRSYFNFTWNIDYHLMVFVKQGKGGLLLISDSQYLLDKNIESIYDYWPGNIILLKNILDEFKYLEEQS
jgi:hypothetical protein